MSETTTGKIIGPNGEDQLVKTTVLDHEDAKLLREYKKFLLKMGWAETLRCKTCFEMLGPASAGMDGRVLDDKIAFRCHHRMVVYVGQSF